MISFYLKKISPELLNVENLEKKEHLQECIVYANNFLKLKFQLKSQFEDVKEYPFIKALGVRLNNDQILKLAKASIVSYISKQTKVSAQINVSKKILEIGNFYANNITGKDVTVAVIDTGINPHIDFCVPKNRILKFVDLINDKKFPYDDNGHGTFVSSLICGSGLASNKKYCGVAPEAKIVSIKALEQNGETGAFKILEAMQWVFDNKKKFDIKVVCMSFGSSPLDKNDPLVLGAEALWNSGIVVVAAAGNSGPDNRSIKSPGFSSKIITVGGVDDKRDENGNFDIEKFQIAPFSSRGPAGNYFKPDLVAPAVNIVGATFDKKNLTFYSKMSGTSVATPIIAGACALILSKNQNITPDQLKIRLLKNCKQLTFEKNAEGYGLANFSRFFDTKI